MSKIFDALEKAETDRVAVRSDPSQTPERPGEESPAPRARATGWWKGLIVGMVVGALGAAIVRSYLVDGRRPAPPAAPAVLESPEDPASASPVASPPDPSTQGPAAKTADDAATASAPAPEPQAQVFPVPAIEPPLPSATATRTQATPTPSRSPSPRRTAVFRIQVGAFAARENAVHMATRLHRLRYPATVQRGRTSAAPWVVVVGTYQSRGAAEAALANLERAGFKGILVSTQPAPPARVKGGRKRARSNG